MRRRSRRSCRTSPPQLHRGRSRHAQEQRAPRRRSNTDVVELLTKRRSAAWSGSEQDLVFYATSPQSFLTPTYLLRRQLYPAMARAGVERAGPTQELRTFHSFRHTFAKRALESGAEITWLSRHLGHSTLKVTTEIYGHWERAERKLQAAKMEGALPV